MAAITFRRPPLAFTVSAFARDDPLVCDLYDDDQVEEVGSQQVCLLLVNFAGRECETLLVTAVFHRTGWNSA